MPFTYHILQQNSKLNNWILAFYGFGQHHKVYEKLKDSLQTNFNFLVIDIPIEPDEKLNRKTFSVFLEKIITIYSIKEIIGISYSMGSRLNLVMCELIPFKIKKIIVIAPDGIQINIWNKIAVHTRLGKIIFKQLMHHPTALVYILHGLNKLKLISHTLYIFCKWQIRDEVNRKKIYSTWKNMKHFLPNLTLINKQIENNNIELTAYFGKQDVVINNKIEKKLRTTFLNATTIVVESNHDLLNENIFTLIKNKLLS